MDANAAKGSRIAGCAEQSRQINYLSSDALGCWWQKDIISLTLVTREPAGQVKEDGDWGMVEWGIIRYFS